MSLAVTHFAVGAGLMELLLLFRSPIRYRQSLVVASGMWALVPDLHYVSPVLRVPLSQLKSTIFGNLFWFHAFLDSLHQGRGTREGAALALLFLLASTVMSEWIRARQSGRDPNVR